jgi:glycosyltransferase involved in cell wall biosynthesis
MDACELTILMPCLNEAETLAVCIQKARQFLLNQNIQGEILIADNGSTDDSRAIAVANGARVIDVDMKGYGAALKGGIAQASGRYIIMGDADDSYDFLNLLPFVTKLREGYELVMGNRFMGGIKEGAMPFMNRYLGNPVLTFIGRTFFSKEVGDFHCGLRGFHRERFLELDCQGNGMEFASEMVVKASLNQLKITEVPTHLFPDGRSRRPHLRPWRDGWRHLRLLLLFSPRWLFLIPGSALMMLGLMLMTVLFIGPVRIAGINFDIHTMLFSSVMMIVGLQAVSFAAFAQTIANTSMPMRWFTLERGLIMGLCILSLGVCGAGYSFSYWLHQAFGPLEPTQMMRLLIPATTSVVIGFQIIFSSFFMSLLGLHYANQK